MTTASSGQDPRQPSHSKQLPQDRQRPASKAASAGRQPGEHLVEGLHAGGRVEPDLLAALVHAEVPEVELVEGRERVLGGVLVGLGAQPGVDRAGGALAVPGAHRDGALAGHRVATGEDAGRPGHQGGLVDLHRVALELDAGDAVQEAGVARLAEREDDRVGLERLEPAGAVRAPVLVELLDLDGEVGVAHRADGAQPVDPDALGLGVLGLGLVGRHLLAGAAVDDDRVVGAEAAGDARGIHGRVAAAVDGDPAGERRLGAGRGAAQELDGVDDARGVLVGDVDPGREVRADRDERRVEAAVAHLGLEVDDAVVLLEGDAEGAQPVDLGVEHDPRQPVAGDAVAHHAARLGPAVAHRDGVAHPAEVVRRGQPARAGADDQHPPAGAGRRRVEGPAVLDGEVAEEPLDPVDRDGTVELEPVAGGFARVVADPAVDGGERVVDGQRRARLPRGRRP